jgi:hypothetical protein
MSSGGGGKGGGKKTTTETTVPEWIRAPAERNLQRAEALQQIEYMPYYGAEVAAFNPNQEMAFQNNANTAAAFGLLAPTDAMAGMPTPTTYDNGMKGYSSIPIYDQAKKDLAANYGDTVDAYDALFGNAVPANVASSSGGGGGRGGIGISFGGQQPQLSQAERMAQTYANVKVGEDANGNSIYGYTGQDERATGGVNMSRAGIRSGTTEPKVNYNVQVNKPKAKSYANQRTYKSKGGTYTNPNNKSYTGGR